LEIVNGAPSRHQTQFDAVRSQQCPIPFSELLLCAALGAGRHRDGSWRGGPNDHQQYRRQGDYREYGRRPY
jgi:hypothetical protein